MGKVKTERADKDSAVVSWLLNGDPAIAWQVKRDLEGKSERNFRLVRRRISSEGWGARLLSFQEESGMWGGGIYGPKWISTTYTMLLLKRFGLDPENPQAHKACALLLNKGFWNDGGINYFASMTQSETCVTGMVLSLLCYFGFPDDRVHRLFQHLLGEQMPDGGWNCEQYRGAVHSSFHTTLSVLEGFLEYERLYGENRKLRRSRERAEEFLLIHRLFRSHRTGDIVDARMTRFSFPPRWKYDAMRVLDYFQARERTFDERMTDALEIVLKKRRGNGRWLLQNRHSGRTFFEMEKAGKESRWNTLRAKRVLQHYGQDISENLIASQRA